MEAFLTGLNNFAGQYYIALKYVFGAAVFFFLFSALLMVFNWMDEIIYRIRMKSVRRKMKSHKKVRVSALPTKSVKKEIGIAELFFLLWIIIGVVGAVIGNDGLISPVFLLAMVFIGYANYRGTATKQYVKRRSQLVEIVRLFAGNLKTYQSVEESLIQLQKQYVKLEKDSQDVGFLENLYKLTDMMNQGSAVEPIADQVFGGDKVYQQFYQIITVAVRSGTANAIEYSLDVTERISRWRKLTTMMNTEVSGVKLIAMVLELLVVAISVATLMSSWGSTPSILHSFFFEDTQNKLIFCGILMAHAFVQYFMLEYLRVRSENV